ncbi:MAG: hypothetical protein N2376_12155, partial [Clostridia bacterium]|nr:hypothetical protein [Clostridia bacterium]
FLFALAGIAVLDVIYRYRVRGSCDLFKILSGKTTARLLQIIVLVFSLCVFSSMLSGAASIGKRMLSLPYPLGVVLILALCLLIVVREIRAVASLGMWLAPLMIAGMLYIALKMQNGVGTVSGLHLFDVPAGMWPVDAFLYVCYNSVLNFIVMAEMLDWIKNRAIGWISGVLSGVILTLLLFIIHDAMLVNWRLLAVSELPMLSLAQTLGQTEGIIYSLVLFAAILTTAVSAGLCFMDGLKSMTGIKKGHSLALLACVSLVFAQQSFSQMVNNFFPLFGYAGVPFFLFILARWGKMLFYED